MTDVRSQTFEQRLGEVFQRTLPKLSPEARQQLAALIAPESRKIIAGVLVVWILGHAVGAGEFVDIAIGAVGIFAIGTAVFSGLDELYEFARGTYFATSDTDLDRAAEHLANGIAILGIQAVLALLFKGRPQGGRVPYGPEPARGPGFRYKPQIVEDPELPAGRGSTTFWGDIEVSITGSAEDRAVVLLHEKVHQFLAPKFYMLRRVRVESRVGSYVNSSLYRYVEEALAETIAQVGGNGFSKLFVGLRFPVDNGYVYLTLPGGYAPWMRGAGLVPEGAGLLGSATVMGLSYQLWFKPGQQASPGAIGGAKRRANVWERAR